jgi:hypothetical protein
MMGFVAIVLLGLARHGFAQAVGVTLSLDSPTVAVSQTTTLRVFAQVVPNLRTNSERIFSWYVDVLNTNGSVASANYAAMQKTASDNDSQASSTGTPDGANRRGVYDFFINRPGAGVTNAVELMAIPITGQAAGQTRFRVQAGTTVPEFSSDFLVATTNGPAYTGGDYAAAFVDLIVTGASGCSPQLLAVPLAGGGGPGGTFQLTFTPCPGRTHTVEYRAALGDVPGWLPLPGAPHNSGTVTITNATNYRFFRVRASQP